MLVDEVDDAPYLTAEQCIASAYGLRTLERFAWYFGLVELRHNVEPGTISRCDVRRSGLFDELCAFSI